MTDFKTNAATPIETRELTADILAREGAIYIPTPNGSPQRTSYNGYDNDAPTHDADYSSSSGDDMKPDEACSDSSSDISIEDTKIDPFKNRRELQDDIAQLESQIHKLRRELALEQVRRPTLYNGSYFARQLDEIRQMIRHWTVTYFTHAGGHWTPSAQRRFERLSEDWAAYLEHEQLRPWLIQARLWHLLQALLFDTMSKKRYSYIFTGRAKNCSFDKMLAEGLRVISLFLARGG